MAMAQVDSITKTVVLLPPAQVQSIDKNAKNTIEESNSTDLKTDSDTNSDIELIIEESDGKEMFSENEDAINDKNSKKELSKDLNANKDEESLKSLDDDITNTADLVRSGFSADEFNDEIDCLDAIDNPSIDTNKEDLSNSTFNPGNSSEAILANNDTLVKSVDNTLTKTVNCSDKECSSGTSENQLICSNLAEKERNNNTTEIIDNDEKRSNSPVRTQLSVSSAPLSESTEEKIDSEVVPQSVLNEDTSKNVTSEINSLVEHQSTSSETHSSNTVEETSVRVREIPTQSTNDCSEQSEKMSIDSDSLSEAIQMENTKKSDCTNSGVVETTANVLADKDVSEPVEKISVDSNSTSEAMSVSSTNDVEKNTENQLENDDLKQTEEMSVDSDFHSKVISTEDIDKSNENCINDVEKVTEKSDSHFKVISTEDFDKSNENDTTVSEKVTENDDPKPVDEMLVDSYSSSKVLSDENMCISEENRISNAIGENLEDDKSISSNSKQNSTEKAQPIECPENNTPPNDDLINEPIKKAQTDDPVHLIQSPMVIDDDKEPNGDDNSDIIIDSVESEIVELDAEDEPVILDDDDDTTERSVNQSSQNIFNQLFANTAKEIAHDDIGAEVVVGDDDLDASTSGLEVLNSFASCDNESRKRRLQQNETSLNGTDEKRARVSEVETSDDCGENQTGTYDYLFRKKRLVNKARKHTSSTNAADTVKEIQKRIQKDLLRQKRSKASSPGHDSIDEFDFEINDNDGDIMNDERGDEAAQQIDNNSYKIKLNYDVISKDNLKSIFQIMRTSLTRRQLEAIVIQKCCEMISDSNEIGTLRRQVADLQQAEMFRKQKILNLEKQISQLRAVCQRFLEQVKENSNKQITPIKITRSVGLQVSRDSSSYNFDAISTATTHKSQDKLKKLLSAPAVNKRSEVESETRQSVSKQRTASPVPSSINHRNNDVRLMNGITRISSPLVNSSSPTTSGSSSPIVSNSRSNKKSTSLTDDNAPVIDLTDKDDKNENEGNVAAKGLLSTVNGTYVTYMPVNKNQDQNRQVMKPGTSILVNGQLLTIQGNIHNSSKYAQLNIPHPAPVPPLPTPVMVPGAKQLPPKPLLKIDKSKAGIMLSWEFPPHSSYAAISKYQLYAYQETSLPARSDLWKAVGDVSALPLPMACTLTQFVEGYKYHFTVRAVDVHNRCGPFSAPRTITL